MADDRYGKKYLESRKKIMDQASPEKLLQAYGSNITRAQSDAINKIKHQRMMELLKENPELHDLVKDTDSSYIFRDYEEDELDPGYATSPFPTFVEHPDVVDYMKESGQRRAKESEEGLKKRRFDRLYNKLRRDNEE